MSDDVIAYSRLSAFHRRIKTLPHTRNFPCIVGAFYKHINSHTQTGRPEQLFCRPYKYLFRAGIEPATRSAAAYRSATAPTVSFRDFLSREIVDRRYLRASRVIVIRLLLILSILEYFTDSDYGHHIRPLIQDSSKKPEPANLGHSFAAVNPCFFAPGFSIRLTDCMQHWRQLDPVCNLFQFSKFPSLN